MAFISKIKKSISNFFYHPKVFYLWENIIFSIIYRHTAVDPEFEEVPGYHGYNSKTNADNAYDWGDFYDSKYHHNFFFFIN